MLFWYLKEREDIKMIHDENDLLTDVELVIVWDFLKTSKHACLYIWNKHPRVIFYWIMYEVIIFKWSYRFT